MAPNREVSGDSTAKRATRESPEEAKRIGSAAARPTKPSTSSSLPATSTTSSAPPATGKEAASSGASPPLSSKLLSVVIIVGLVLPLAYLGWVALDRSKDKNTIGDAFGTLLFLIVIAAVLWSRIRFGLRVRSMTSAQIRAEIRPRGGEMKRRLHLLRRSPLAMAGLIIVGFLVSLAVLAPVLEAVGVLDHWDPKRSENPSAQNYFQLLPPSTSPPSQLDLYLTQTYSTGPLNGPLSGFGVRSAGRGNISATGDFFFPLTTAVILNISDQATSLDRVEIVVPEKRVQAGGSMGIEARAYDAQGRRVSASFVWDEDGDGAGIFPPAAPKTTLFTSVAAGGSSVKVTVTATLWRDQPSKSAETTVSVESQMPPWALSDVVVWPETTIGESTVFKGNVTEWKPKKLEVRAFAANGSRIPPGLLGVTWEILPGNHNASFQPDPNLPVWKANVTNTRRFINGVPVDVRATVSLGPDTAQNSSNILFLNLLDFDRVEVTPAKATALRGEYVELRARAINDDPPQVIVDAVFSWQVNFAGGGRPAATDYSSAGPSVTERLEIATPAPGGYNVQIENEAGVGPYYIDAEIKRLVWDPKNLTTQEKTETVSLCRPVEPTPCETFKAANMLGGGEPMKAGETRDHTFDLGTDVKSLRVRLYGPDAALFGRDNVFGRDYLSILIWGSQISLRISFIVVASSVLIGVVLGGLAGYLGGKVDEIVMRITDVFLAIPGLILAMGVAAVLTRSLDNIMYALVVVSWPGYTRLIRGQALAVRESLFVEAARAVGVPEGRIILRHVIPNCLSPVLVSATLDIGGIVLLAAGLSFIGFGALPPTPEWGLLIFEGTSLVGTAWWLVTLPGLLIFAFVLGFNLFGDGLRDILDPKLRQ